MSAMDVGCGMGYFSIPMARLVGESGCVVAVELRQERLDVLMSRAAHAGVASRIQPVKCESGDLRASVTVDFALAFYVLHETADPATVLRQVRACVKDGGALLIAEPSFEVSARQFDATLDLARAAAFTVARRFSLRLTRAALLRAE